MKPHGVNRSYNEYKEEGYAGTIDVYLTIHERWYEEGGTGPKGSGQVPDEMKMEIVVDSTGDSSGIEGTHEVYAYTTLPASVHRFSMKKLRTEKIKELVTQLFSQLE